MNITLSKDKLKSLEKQIQKLKTCKPSDINKEVDNLSTSLKNVFDCEVRVSLAHKFPDSSNCQVMCFPVAFENPDDKLDGLVYFMGIILGSNLLEKLDAKQLVAVLLHEYGHWYMNYKTALPYMKHLIETGQKIGLVAGAVLLQPVLWPTVLLMAFISSTVTSTMSHNIEYGCDKIAVKYGYGGDLYRAFKYMDKLEQKYKKKQSTISSFFGSLKDYLFGTTHPALEDRMERIISILKTEHPEIFESPDAKKLIKKYYGIQL